MIISHEDMHKKNYHLLSAIESLGPLPFFTLKQKEKPGQAPTWIPNKEYEFSDVLRKYHKERINELAKLGWLS